MGLLDNIGKFLGDEETQLNLASGLAGMTANPNAGNIQQGYQNRLTALRGDRKLEGAKKLEADKLKRHTASALQLLGNEFPDISDAVAGGFLDPNAGVTEARKRKAAGTKERRIVQGSDGFNYYADDQTRVLPNAAAPDEKDTSLMRNFQFYIDKGKTPDEAMALLKAGNTVNMGDNKYLQGLGTGASNILAGRQQKAQSAVGTINTINNLRPLLEGGADGIGVFSGPLAENQMLIARLGSKLGVSGKDSQEVLNNTTAAMQKLASLELTAAQGMKGQGQITENERKLIKKAAGGDLMKMTSGEVTELLNGLEKLSRQQITEYGTFLDTGMSSPDAQQFKPIYQVSAPAAYTPSGVTVKRIN